ncbi:MAG: hypothetical protein Q4G62_07160 [Pseudomonadota bacterium]|nr:hypothetical protein [Pseudomonadota bacterium]
MSRLSLYTAIYCLMLAGIWFFTDFGYAFVVYICVNIGAGTALAWELAQVTVYDNENEGDEQ